MKLFPKNSREWILWIILIVILTSIFWIVVQNFSTGSALSYVSFAGTLISIILAVLAIGYTYGESISQKNDSNTLAHQLSEMNSLLRKLEDQSDILRRIANRIDDKIVPELEVLNTHLIPPTIADLNDESFNGSDVLTKDYISQFIKTLTSHHISLLFIIYLGHLKTEKDYENWRQEVADLYFDTVPHDTEFFYYWLGAYHSAITLLLKVFQQASLLTLTKTGIKTSPELEALIKESVVNPTEMNDDVTQLLYQKLQNYL